MAVYHAPGHHYPGPQIIVNRGGGSIPGPDFVPFILLGYAPRVIFPNVYGVLRRPVVFIGGDPGPSNGGRPGPVPGGGYPLPYTSYTRD